MDRARVAILVFILSALMVLSLSFAYIPEKGLNLSNVTKSLSSEADSQKGMKNPANAERQREQNGGKVPPDADFTFRPTNEKASCPVEIRPTDPFLVCVDTPAKGIPIKAGSYWDMLVKYDGLYYVPLEGPRLIKGVNDRAYLHTDRPLVLSYPGGEFSIWVNSSFPGRLVPVNSKYLIVSNISQPYVVYHWRITYKVDENAPPGYYPLFFLLNASDGVIANALLTWVEVLPKAVVRITSMPSQLSGNGTLKMTVSGTVTYFNGSPVKGGTIRITINRTKSERGIVVGKGNVVNGTFNVSCSIPPGAIGKYSVVAHYRGPYAYPSNSDPEVVIKRYPAIDANVTVSDGVTYVRGAVHYGTLPLNGSVVILARRGKEVVKIQQNLENGTFSVRIAGKVEEVEVIYGGGGFYLPTRKVVYKKKGLLPEGFHIDSLHRSFRGLTLLPLSLLAVVGAGFLVARRRKEVPTEDVVVERVENFKEVSLGRRVFLPGEEVELSVPPECDVLLDGKAVKRSLRLSTPGKHLLEICGRAFEIYVLPPKEAIIKLYELHFLPFARSTVYVDNRTPYEIARAFGSTDFFRDAMRVARIFTLARYSLRKVGEGDFWEVVETMERMGVFK
ncbi:Ig-like domain-containing protein [Thermococcus sp.]|uniref:Ig-like domain-containing protein n=1 Tax=Thermococcus sp. TaxID=35749 RepID=UPI00262F566F|nr:Ig-like domain-containing protein [Thermococcus sp.]